MSLKLGNTTISGVTTPINGSIAIGQIISSIVPLTDAGLHLLDGALIQGGGVYDAFVQYIANLFNLYPQCFTDETTWQNTVNSKGVCGKFVYNSVNNTVRLPKITGFIEGTIDSNALGDLVNAGLPNITGTLQYAELSQSVSGAFNLDSSSWAHSNGYVEGGGGYISFDASRSSSIYGNSSTVQPQSIKVFYYIVIATTTKTDIEVDIDEVITDLNSKANDTDVVHKIGNETISGVKTFNNAINLAHGVWNAVGSNAYMGDMYQAGAVCFKGISDSTKLVLLNRAENVALGFYIDENDNNALKLINPTFNATAWGSVTAMVSQSYGGGGYIKFNHGLIIQWGIAQGNQNASTVTFPIPFSSTNYCISANSIDFTGDMFAQTVNNRTTTTCQLYGNYNAATANRMWIAVGY